jgi:hypothetical protein
MGWGDSPWGTIVWGADTVAPLLVSLQGSSRTVTLAYSEPLDAASVPNPSFYNLDVEYQEPTHTVGYELGIADVDVFGNTVLLTLVAPLPTAGPGTYTFTLSYIVPLAGKVRDLGGNNAAGFVGQPVVVSFTYSSSRVSDPAGGWTYKGE